MLPTTLAPPGTGRQLPLTIVISCDVTCATKATSSGAHLFLVSASSASDYAYQAPQIEAVHPPGAPHGGIPVTVMGKSFGTHSSTAAGEEGEHRACSICKRRVDHLWISDSSLVLLTPPVMAEKSAASEEPGTKGQGQALPIPATDRCETLGGKATVAVVVGGQRGQSKSVFSYLGGTAVIELAVAQQPTRAQLLSFRQWLVSVLALESAHQVYILDDPRRRQTAPTVRIRIFGTQNDPERGSADLQNLLFLARSAEGFQGAGLTVLEVRVPGEQAIIPGTGGALPSTPDSTASLVSIDAGEDKGRGIWAEAGVGVGVCLGLGLLAGCVYRRIRIGRATGREDGAAVADQAPAEQRGNVAGMVVTDFESTLGLEDGLPRTQSDATRSTRMEVDAPVLGGDSRGMAVEDMLRTRSFTGAVDGGAGGFVGENEVEGVLGFTGIDRVHSAPLQERRRERRLPSMAGVCLQCRRSGFRTCIHRSIRIQQNGDCASTHESTSSVTSFATNEFFGLQDTMDAEAEARIEGEDELLCFVCLERPRSALVIHDDDEKSTHEGLCLDCACKIMENGGTCPLCRCRIFGVASSQSRRVIEEATRAATAPALGAHTVGPGLYPDLTDALLGRRRQ